MNNECLGMKYILKRKEERVLEAVFSTKNNKKCIDFNLLIENEKVSDYHIMKLNISDYFLKLNQIIELGIFHFEEYPDKDTLFSRDIQRNFDLAMRQNTKFNFLKAFCNFCSVDELVDLSDNSLVYVLHTLNYDTVLVLILESDLLRLKKLSALELDTPFVRLDSLHF